MVLVATDLDGTLLRSDGTLSERSRAALHAVAAAGITTVLVSARGPNGVGLVADESELSGKAICSNGAIVLDLDTRQILRVRELETAVATELVRGLRERFPEIGRAHV